MAVSFALLAHQGGWDEVLLVGGPILVIIAVLAIAKQRVDKLHGASAGDTVDDSAPDDSAPDDSAPGDSASDPRS
jgi:hypothetical protein